MTFIVKVRCGVEAAIANHLWLDGREVRFDYLALVTSDPMVPAWHRFLKGVFDPMNGVFRPLHFQKAVTRGVINCGLANYRQFLHGTSPDRVESPDAFAFALRMNMVRLCVSDEQRFNGRETLEQFKSRANGLVDDIVRQLSRL